MIIPQTDTIEVNPVVAEVVEIQEVEPIQEPEPVPVTVAPAKKTYLAVKTNLLYDAVSALNFEVEVPVAGRWSVMVEDVFPWWHIDNKYAFQPSAPLLFPVKPVGNTPPKAAHIASARVSPASHQVVSGKFALCF